MGKTIDVIEAARRLGVDASRVRVLLRQRRIKGARLVGRVWMIPEDFSVTPGTRGPALTAGSLGADLIANDTAPRRRTKTE